MSHRHTAALDFAEVALKRISEDAVSKRRSVDDGASSKHTINEGDLGDEADEQSLADTWQFLGSKNGVRIYSKSGKIPLLHEHDEQQQQKEEGKGKEKGGPDAPDHTLPFFRGEGIIPGDWKLSDLLATVVSPGARDLWDERYRASSSEVVAILSENDQLLHSSIVSPFPVGARDTVIAARQCQTTPNLAFYSSTSVEDPLVPPGNVARNNVKLSGWAFRRLSPEEPDDLEMMEEEEQEEAEEQPMRKRANSRAFSRQFDPLSNALPNLSRQRSVLQSGDRRSLSARPGLMHRHSNSLAYAVEASKSQPNVSPARSKPKGIRTTFVLKTNPGGSLPVTFINSLNVSVPLCIASLSRYLKQYGFAPHLVHRCGIRLLSEKFEPQMGAYHLIFSPSENAPPEVQLRYHGLAFEGRCEVSVSGARWSIEHDVAQSPVQSSSRPQLRQRFSTSAAVPRATGDTSSIDAGGDVDAARLPGDEGGCTLKLRLEPKASIVQVTLSKRAPKDSESGVGYVVQIGAAMTSAMASARNEMEALEEERFGQLRKVNHSSTMRIGRKDEDAEGEVELERADVIARAMKEAFAGIGRQSGLKSRLAKDSMQELRSGAASPVR